MRVIFLSNKYHRSAVVDAANGTPLFQLSTPGYREHRTTMHDQQGNAVGTYTRCVWKSDKITFRGEAKRLDEWMPRSWSKRRLVAPDGRVYAWKKKCWQTFYELVDCQTKRVVAQAQRERIDTSGFFSKRRIVIDVLPDVVHMVDAIVFSFVIWQRLRRQEAANASAAGAAGGASG